MKLSKYCDEQENLWNKEELIKTDELIKYLNSVIDKDLYKLANTNDSLEVFNKLKVWLFKLYNKELLDGLNNIGADVERFKKGLIYSLIMGVTRDRSNTEIIYEVLKSNKVIEKISFVDETYEIITKDFGNIQFTKAKKSFENDKETLDYLDKLGDSVIGGCHEISLYLIKNFKMFKAVTAICKKAIGTSYYHSFVLDEEENVIDFTSNVIMPKEQYYMLNEVQELNLVDYKECIKESKETIEFDESGTLQDLLRNAIYKELKE